MRRKLEARGPTLEGAVPHATRYGCSVPRITSLRQRVVESQSVEDHGVVKRTHKAVNLPLPSIAIISRIQDKHCILMHIAMHDRQRRRLR